MVGHKLTEETKNKISEANKGKHNSIQTQFQKGHAKILGSEKGWFKKGEQNGIQFKKGDKTRLGKKHTEETKQKIANTRKI